MFDVFDKLCSSFGQVGTPPYGTQPYGTQPCSTVPSPTLRYPALPYGTQPSPTPSFPTFSTLNPPPPCLYLLQLPFPLCFTFCFAPF